MLFNQNLSRLGVVLVAQFVLLTGRVLPAFGGVQATRNFSQLGIVVFVAKACLPKKTTHHEKLVPFKAVHRYMHVPRHWTTLWTTLLLERQSLRTPLLLLV